MFSEEAIALAKPCIEAIKKISKRGINPMTGAKLTVPEWEWEPEVGETLILEDGSAHQVVMICYHSPKDRRAQILQVEWPWRPVDASKDATPLLHWEKIEEILEGMGYVFQEPIRRCYGSEGFKCHCVISLNGKRVGWGWGKDRTKAVYEAVIELGKETNAKHRDK